MIFFVILQSLRRIKNIFSGIVWTLVLAYLSIIVLTHIPPVQAFIGAKVSQALEEKFNTKVSIGKINLGFLNRIIIDDVVILDQHQQRMLAASRVSVKFDYLPLAQGRVVISSTQLFGLDANLYKETAESKPKLSVFTGFPGFKRYHPAHPTRFSYTLIGDTPWKFGIPPT